MICVSIGRGRHRMMMAEHRHLAEQGVQLVELRVDCIRRQLNIRRLLADRPCPCIVACRRESDGGQWTGSEEARIMALRTAIVEGTDYVDLEEDIAEKIPRYGKTQRIISFHDFRETPEDLPEVHRRLAGLDPDIIKIATMTHRPGDNQRMLQLIAESEIPTVGICMGEIGIPTRILAGKFGAPFTYATFHHERKLTPGEISLKQMRDVYRYDSINADTEICGVIADPVSYNTLPVVYNAAFAEQKLNKVFVPFRVPRDYLAPFMDTCEKLAIKGLSVGIPHKDEIVRHLSQGDGAVRNIGTANTVIFDRRGAVGYNTEYAGFIEALDQLLPEEERGRSFVGKTALVLGAGSVSRAVSFALKRREADVVITSRNHELAGMLAERLSCRSVQWYECNRIEADILVNATPIGTHPNLDETPFDRKYLQRSTMVVDLVYNPEQTLLIKQARELGCRTVTGVDVFVREAALQLERFTGQKTAMELIRNELKRAIGPAKV